MIKRREKSEVVSTISIIIAIRDGYYVGIVVPAVLNSNP